MNSINERYATLLKTKAASTDNYVESGVQTLNMLLKNKEVHEAAAVATAAGSQVRTDDWRMTAWTDGRLTHEWLMNGS